MIKKKSSYSVVLVFIILCIQGIVNAQGGKPVSFSVHDLKDTDSGNKKDLKELLPTEDFAEPTILMFVTDIGKKTPDKNVVKLAQLIDVVVKEYKEENDTRGAILFRGESYVTAKEELAKAQLTIPVAEVNGVIPTEYGISNAVPVTVVMWTKSNIEKDNIKAWTFKDFAALDPQGQEMVVKFIELLN